MFKRLLSIFRRNPENEENIQLWTMLNGEQVRIVDMTDDHLRNCIFYLNRRFGQLSPLIMRHGPWDKWPEYNAMCREADRRKLRWVPEHVGSSHIKVRT